MLKKLRAEIESVLGHDQNSPEHTSSACHISKTSSKIESKLHQGRLVPIPRSQPTYRPLRLLNPPALRLYPPVPINTRFCKQATTLPRGGGPDGQSPILVREGMPVADSVYHMHRRRDLYGDDAGIFRPERWDGAELADIKWGYLPFNGGPQLCLGSESIYILLR